MATSAASKMVASLVMYPHEVVRSNMQIDGSGPLSGFATACRRIFRQDGLRGFYRCGCPARALPCCAV